MIIADKFIYTHLPHTAGGFVTKFLLEAVGQESVVQMRKHYPVSELPFRLDRPLIGTIRNPWAWYVGTHHYRQKNGIVRVEGYDPRVKSFKECTLAFMEHDNSARYGVGVYTERFLRFFCKDYDKIVASPSSIRAALAEPEKHISLSYALEIESDLTHQLLDTLDELGIVISPDRREKLVSMGHVNKSQHSHYSDYYDEELMEVVAEKDKIFIETYGYKFEDQ